MTISSTNRKAGPFIGNGSASVFAFSFRVFAASDLEVVRIAVATGVETTLTINSAYTVSLNADQNSNPGGSITLTGGVLASGYNLIITSNIANLQPTDLTNQGGFYPEVITGALDRATIQIQQLDEHINRTLSYPITDPAIGREIPAVSLRANKFLSFDENGEPVAALPSTVVGWENYQAQAAASASSAASSATSATASATSATASASTASAAATSASASATSATSSASAAASARDAALIGAGVYVDEATGRAAVADGAAFKVQGSGDVAAYEYRRVNSGSSTLIATYPSLSALTAIASAVGSVTQAGFPKPLVATGTTVPALYTIAPETSAPANGFVTDVSIGAAAAGEAIISVITINTGTGVVTAITATTQLSVTAGVATYPLNLPIAAGQYVAITGSNYKYQAGAPGGRSVWAKSGSVLAVSDTLTFSTAHRFEINFTIETGARGELSILQDSALTEPSLNSDLTTLNSVGFPNPIVLTGSTVPANYTIFPRNLAVDGGVLTSLTVGCASAGSMNIYVASITSGGVITIVSTTTVSTAVGTNTYALNIAVGAGQYVGIGGGNYYFQAFSNPTGLACWLKNGVPANSDTLTDSAQHRYEVQFSIGSPLRKTIIDLSSSASGQAGGFTQLDSADNTGVADATSVFASARGSHPAPYVRPGSFALTAIPSSGSGFWGPGRPYLNSDRFFLPQNPESGNLLTGLRAALQENISAGDVLTLIGDSISHWAYATTGAKHWFNMFTRFANAGIAKDEPVMTALRSSSTYTPAFYGVTTSGTITTGTRGPITESAILASGASISFSGAYEQVDVFYTQEPGAGSLAFAYNGGSAYKTVSAAGTLTLDVYTGPSATTSNTSGTYTITATGGAVEITGLIRLAPKTAGTPPRLRTNRSSHGSYAFPSFGAAATTSILKQGTYAGGKCLPIIALGINDSFGTAPATIVTQATSVLDALVAGGVTRIFAIPPMRPSSGWDSSYTGGRTYDGAAGPLRKLYRDRGVIVLPADLVDWVGQTLFSDGLHPNDEGNDKLAQIVIESISRKGA